LNRLSRTIIILIFLLPYKTGICQEVSYVQDISVSDDNFPQERGRFSPDPRKASMYAAVLPGLGQIYNRKYWKVPIVYGGFAALTWYTFFSHDEFVRYRTALDYSTDNDPSTVHEFAGDPRYTDEVLTRFKDYYRRERDRTVLLTTVFYAITIVDAAVDAHLFEFDVSDDLGMKLGPSFKGAGKPVPGKPGAQFGLGVRFSLNF
jgi:hypothetical protein